MPDLKQKKNNQITTDFFITDADHTTLDEKPAIRLYGRTEDGKSAIVLTTDFEPYFYIIPKDDPKDTQKKITELKLKDAQAQPINIKSTTIQKKTVASKEIPVIKIIAHTPKDIPKLKDAIKHLDFVEDKREYDIPFARRYLFDKDITPMSWLKVKGTEIKTKTRYSCDTTIMADVIEKKETGQDFPKLNI
ncbi:MAG: hypothetical protein GQ477_00995, partial [Nanohaloarchaea archaeon]|nr:hypothetical protein [Candidatus Nanohaloarchaea archaeon]